MSRILIPFAHFLTCVLLCIMSAGTLWGQKPKEWSSAAIQQEIQKLGVLGSVLYVAAHPDDENTRLIAWLANEKKYRTAYLSLTRGDGGQNLIGPELRERLGLIRTQELLQARRVDGGQQFFSRANDFGFSKHPDETFAIWDKETILADAVWVIRKFKPDVIITRFNTTPGTTHGHHTASAIIAEEAMKAAADPKRFPDQLKHVQVWQAKRLLWNTSAWFFQGREAEFDTTKLVSLQIGGYNPLLGKSYTELAAESRSMHRSQGFGSASSRENPVEYLMPIVGDVPNKQLFSGITTDWSRIKGGEKIENMVKQLQKSFNPLNPWLSVPQLVKLHQAIKALPENPYKTTKLEDVEQLILASTGLFAEASTQEISAAPTGSLQLKLEAVSRAPVTVKLLHIAAPAIDWDTTFSRSMATNEPLFITKTISIPAKTPISQPYWLIKEPAKGYFRVEQPELIGQAQNQAPVKVRMLFSIEGLEVPITVPLVHKHVEPAIGELYQPFVITPAVMVTPTQDQLIFSSDEPQQLEVRVRAGKAFEQGSLSLNLPQSWKAEPASIPLESMQKGEERVYRFSVTPPQKASKGTITAVAKLSDKVYNRGYETLNFPHFPVQTLFPESKIGVVRLDLNRDGDRIGYIVGAGDAVPLNLEQVGYQVSLLDPANINLQQLKKFDAVMLGIRAFNTQESLKYANKVLEAYARAGGVVILQYNTNHGLVTPDLAPIPLQLGRDRITDEDAAVRLVAPQHQALNYPNKITEQDFSGWVQERGLYFASSWSPEWQPLISSNDAGEKPLEGGLLVAPIGNGYYVYSGYSWFRQLPAGVPGAYRLLANLLALGKNASTK